MGDGVEQRARAPAVVLVAALVVITIGALVGTTVIFFAEAERASAAVTVNKTQARAMAWSGVQAVMAELAAQRDGLVAGEKPKVTERWSAPVPDGDTGSRWGFRIVPGRGGAVVESEMGRVCINTATEEMLEKAGFAKDVAGRVVGAREKRKFASVAELLNVEGVSAAVLYGRGGSEGEGGGASSATPADVAPAAPPIVPGAAPATSGALADRLTVFSFDPDVQVGWGPKASEVAGNRRINLNAPWSERLADAIERRWDKNVADAIKGMMEGGDRFETTSDIVKKMRALSLKPADWAEGLDALTCSADEYRIGLVDLGTATAEVLRCVPGVSDDAAKAIVLRRDKLDEERRRTIAWPVVEGILKEDEFEQACPWLTMRSMQWRVVVEGGIMPKEDEGSSMADSPFGATEEELAARAGLRDHVVLEAVIDVSSKRARVAYLRDVTMQGVAEELGAIAREREAAEKEAAGTVDVARAGASRGAGPKPKAAAQPGDVPQPVGLDLDTDLAPGDMDLSAEKEKLGAEAGRHEEDAGGRAVPAAPVEGKDLRVGRWRAG